MSVINRVKPSAGQLQGEAYAEQDDLQDGEDSAGEDLYE